MKKLFLFLIIVVAASSLHAQNYTDLVKFQANGTNMGNVDDDRKTEISNANLELYFGIPVTAKTIVIAGFTYENTRLGLGFTDDRSNLIMTRLNLGLKLDHGNGWSGTYVALPKIASNFENVGGDDFQFGGLALWEKKYSARKGIKFGGYASSEEFGTTITILVGAWYKSPNGKFYVNSVFPIRTEANYALTDRLSLGANLLTSIKSYNLNQSASQFYVQEESIRFNLYAGVGFLDDTILLRGKIGFDSTDYGLYNSGDTVGAQLLIFNFKDDNRNRLNSEFEGALFYGVDLIFRAGI